MARRSLRYTGRIARHVGALALVAVWALLPATTAAPAVAAAVPARGLPTQTVPPPGESEFHSWAVAPTGTDPSQPGDRPFLSYEIAPGQTQQDSVTLWNFSNVQLTFNVYATDAYNNAAGNFTLLPGSQQPSEAGSWVTLATHGIAVAPSQSVVIPITVSVPADASPGDHAAGIVASSVTTTDQAGHQVVLDRRAGTRVYIRVPGAIHPALEVSQLGAKYHGALNPLDGELEVRYTVFNAGNVRLGTTQALSVSDVFGAVADRRPPKIDELLPGNSVTITRRFTGVAATVRLTTGVTLHPFAPTAGQTASGQTASGQTAAPTHLATVSRTDPVWAIPWSLIAALVLLLLLIWLLRRWRARSEARTAPPSGPPRTRPVPPGVDGGGNGSVAPVPSGARSG